MSRQQRFCPHCGAPQQPGASICRACDQPLRATGIAPEPAQSPQVTPVPAAAHTLRDSVPSFKIPGSEAWLWLGLLTSICAAGGAAALAVGADGAGYGLLLFGLTLLITLLVLWVGGLVHARRGRAFLASDRPLVSWVYTADEWQQVRTYLYEKERSEQPPLGCLPVLFGLVGVLAGAMIGFDEGVPEAVLGALIGMAIGAAVGGGLIVPVYLFNRSVQQSALKREDPPAVAVGVHELFYDQIYFDGNQYRIEAIDLLLDAPPRLQIETSTIRGSFSAAFPGTILVPQRMLDAVQQALPQVQTE
jgi:hypothetical protein